MMFILMYTYMMLCVNDKGNYTIRYEGTNFVTKRASNSILSKFGNEAERAYTAWDEEIKQVELHFMNHLF